MNQKGFSKIILLVVVVLLVGAVGYFAMIKRSAPPAKQSTTATQSESQIRDQITYRNDKYRFEFQYSKDFTIFERQTVDNLGGPVTRVELTSQGSDYEIGVTLLKANTAAIPLEDVRKDLEKDKSKNHYREISAGLFSGYQVKQELNYNEGKKTAVVYQLLNKENKSQWLRVEIISALNTPLPVADAEAHAINIISTFKFTK